jgi:MOSC domain-containing protein YiiM
VKLNFSHSCVREILSLEGENNFMETITHLSMAELEAGLGIIRQSPQDDGILKMIVRRPKVDERELVNEAELNLEVGLVGDTWKMRGSKATPDGSANINAQITLMNMRAIALLAQDETRWALAGDQLFVDFDLSEANLPAGSRIAIGSAILEVSATPHTGCAKFSERFGKDALKFVNSPEGKQLHLRGINARVVQAGEIKVGDSVRKI